MVIVTFAAFAVGDIVESSYDRSGGEVFRATSRTKFRVNLALKAAALVRASLR